MATSDPLRTSARYSYHSPIIAIEKWDNHVNRSIPLLFVAAILSTAACEKPGAPNPIVGTWMVHDGKAPFPMHMYVFNADGTMQQANPDAGDAHGSDSDGKGIWVAEGTHIRGKWVEIMADRATHLFTGRGEYSFVISASGDRLSGEGKMALFSANGDSIGVIPTTFDGNRVTIR